MNNNESTIIEESFKENRLKAIDLEDAYDKKFNAFCLTVSGYSVERLQSTLEKKQSELVKAKEDLKSADKGDKLNLRLKIDYLKNACAKCKALINRKSKNDNIVNESTSGIDLLIGGIIFAIPTIIISAIAITEIGKVNIRKALKYYPMMHPDCDGIDLFDKKVYTIKPMTNDYDKEASILRKLGNHAMCYIKDKEICFFYTIRKKTSYHYRGYTTTTSFNASINNDKCKLHKSYYLAAMLLDAKMQDSETVKWAKEVIKEAKKKGIC